MNSCKFYDRLVVYIENDQTLILLITRAIRQCQTWIDCWMGLEVDKKSPNIGSTMSIGDRQRCARSQ